MNTFKHNKLIRILTTMTIISASAGLLPATTVLAADMSNGAANFYKSEKVTVQKVTFKNQYNMNVVGNLFMPKELDQKAKSPAIVVGHPMGAIK